MKKITLLQRKSFGTLLIDSIDFIIQNFLSYSRAFLYIVLPIAFLSAITATLVLSHSKVIEKFAHQIRTNISFMSATFVGEMTVLFILFLIIILVTLIKDTLTYQYLLLYEIKEDPSTITLKELWERTKSNLLTMLISFVYYANLLFLLLFVSVVLINTFSGMGTLFIAIMEFVLLIFAVYFVVATNAFFFVRLREGIGPTKAIIRCFKLIQGYWWRSFAILFLTVFLVIIVQMICEAPLSLMNDRWKVPFTPSLYFDVQVISLTLGMYLSAIINIAICLNYYSLVSIADIPQAGSEL